ncbi:MAG: VWA domain-containing protein [Acidobacteria bacterium]|nr:MAG: VWA domain-containing protein [Acidobacteriota bacterium]
MSKRSRRSCCRRFPWPVFIVIAVVMAVHDWDDDRPSRRRTVKVEHDLPASAPVAPPGGETAASASTNVPANALANAPAAGLDREPFGEPSLMRNLYLVVDASASMGGEPGRHCLADRPFPTKMAAGQAALRTFVEQLPDDVNLGLYVFDRDVPRQLLALGEADHAAWRAAVDGIEAGGRAHLEKAIRFAVDRLVEQRRRQAGYGEFRLLLLTDETSHDLRDAAAYAARRGIPVYAVGLCTGAAHPMADRVYSYRSAERFADLLLELEASLTPPPPFEPAG